MTGKIKQLYSAELDKYLVKHQMNLILNVENRIKLKLLQFMP